MDIRTAYSSFRPELFRSSIIRSIKNTRCWAALIRCLVNSSGDAVVFAASTERLAVLNALRSSPSPITLHSRKTETVDVLIWSNRVPPATPSLRSPATKPLLASPPGTATTEKPTATSSETPIKFPPPAAKGGADQRRLNRSQSPTLVRHATFTGAGSGTKVFGLYAKQRT